MSDEVDDYIYTLFQDAGQTIEWNWPYLDDAFWDVSAVPQGTNNEVEIIRVRVASDSNGTRIIFFTVQNNTDNPTNFTAAFVRAPTSD